MPRGLKLGSRFSTPEMITEAERGSTSEFGRFSDSYDRLVGDVAYASLASPFKYSRLGSCELVVRERSLLVEFGELGDLVCDGRRTG